MDATLQVMIITHNNANNQIEVCTNQLTKHCISLVLQVIDNSDQVRMHIRE